MHRWTWLLLAALLAIPAVAFGQDPSDFSPDQWSVLTEGPRFFAALVAGLLLAFAFQMMLTQLSVAAGVSAIGDLHRLVHGPREDGEHGTLRRGDATGLRDTWVGHTGTGPHPVGTDATEAVRRGDPARNVVPGAGHTTPSGITEARPHEVDTAPGMHVPVADVYGHTIGADGTELSTGRVQQHVGTRPPAEIEGRAHRETTWGDTVRKALAGAGLWAMLTSSLALFFASWLAVELSLTLDFVVGAVVGLAIWASFYLLLTVWEAAALTSLAGSITRLATEGTRTVLGGVSAVFRRSPERRLVHTVREAAGAVADELATHVDTRRLERKLDRLVRRLEPHEIDPERVKHEVLDLLKHVRLEADVADPYTEEHLTARFVERGLHLPEARKVARGVRSAIDAARHLRSEVAEHGATATAFGVAARTVGGAMTDEEVAEFRRRFEEVLRGTHRPELDPEALEQDLEALFTHPREGLDRLRHRLSLVDRDTVVALISQRPGMDEERAREWVERVERVLDRLRGLVGGRGTDPAEVARAREGRAVVAHADRERVWTEVIDEYVDAYRRPGVADEHLRRQAREVFEEEPGETPESLLARLRRLSREDLRALIARIPGLDEHRADQLLDALVHGRDEVIHRLEQAQERAVHGAEVARDFAVDQAEEVRRTTSAAAWWSFLSAAVSGLAAAAGGLTAVALTL